MAISSSGLTHFLFFISSSFSPSVFPILLHVSPILPVYRLADIKEKIIRVVSRCYDLCRVATVEHFDPLRYLFAES